MVSAKEAACWSLRLPISRLIYQNRCLYIRAGELKQTNELMSESTHPSDSEIILVNLRKRLDLFEEVLVK